MNKALKGIKILDISRILAGPDCTQVLPDLSQTREQAPSCIPSTSLSDIFFSFAGGDPDRRDDCVRSPRNRHAFRITFLWPGVSCRWNFGTQLLHINQRETFSRTPGRPDKPRARRHLLLAYFLHSPFIRITKII